MSDQKQSYSDLPTTSDELRIRLVKVLHSIISETDLSDTPLTIGILGPWGSGKTS